MNSLTRSLRKIRHVYERTVPFLKVFFSLNGMGSRDGRTLIWGKLRRVSISFFPPLAHYLQKKYGMSGGCTQCGASCKIMFQCPHWDDSTHLCTVYEDRPNICRLFPITPADLRDRNIVMKGTLCGFHFKDRNAK
jgi:hypothetical protein